MNVEGDAVNVDVNDGDAECDCAALDCKQLLLLRERASV